MFDFDTIYKDLPEEAGVYKYLNKKKEVIYVGKAKNLKKRIASYFKNYYTQSYKNKLLIDNINHIECVIVNNEHDAFILENNLIKQLKPKYNIDLKDDKTFPYLVIKKENFPRIYLTRQKINNGSEYLGPFTNAILSRFVLNFIKDLYPIRTCNLNLTADNINAKKYKVCLEYHIKKCKGPCQNFQSEEDYNNNVDEIRSLVKTNFKELIKDFKNKMNEAAENLDFEIAQSYKEKIEAIHDFESKSIIEVNSNINTDVFAIDEIDNIFILTMLKIREGKIIETKNLKLEAKLNETKEEVLNFAINHLYTENACEVKEIITPFELALDTNNMTSIVPIKGDKKNFLDLAFKNVAFLKNDFIKKKIYTSQKIAEKSELILKLQNELHLNKLPLRIECFDNSNFQGSFPVSAMVSFYNGLPDKNNYRMFKVKTVQGIDDFATMKEVVYRRYKRLLENNSPLPDLIIIDGGKGQLSVALESLKRLNLEINIIGLAKKNEEIFFPNDKESIKLVYHSPTLNLVKQIRDEVHRFGITFHRKLRLKGTIKTSLMNINGVGEETAKKLLKHFKSVENIKNTTHEKIAKIVGNDKAKLIEKYFAI